jgi:hypothetical protein
MNYRVPVPTSMVVITVPTSNVRPLRTEIRRHILEGTFSDELKEVMFKLYSDLKE